MFELPHQCVNRSDQPRDQQPCILRGGFLQLRTPDFRVVTVRQVVAKLFDRSLQCPYRGNRPVRGRAETLSKSEVGNGLQSPSTPSVPVAFELYVNSSSVFYRSTKVEAHDVYHSRRLAPGRPMTPSPKCTAQCCFRGMEHRAANAPGLSIDSGCFDLKFSLVRGPNRARSPHSLAPSRTRIPRVHKTWAVPDSTI